MDALIKRIKERLETHKFCSAFENELERIWPRERSHRQKRIEAIEAFAKRNGWSVTVRDSGIRATFRKLESPSGQKQPKKAAPLAA
jgi:hypothetical protein